MSTRLETTAQADGPVWLKLDYAQPQKKALMVDTFEMQSTMRVTAAAKQRSAAKSRKWKSTASGSTRKQAPKLRTRKFVCHASGESKTHEMSGFSLSLKCLLTKGAMCCACFKGTLSVQP